MKLYTDIDTRPGVGSRCSSQVFSFDLEVQDFNVTITSDQIEDDEVRMFCVDAIWVILREHQWATQLFVAQIRLFSKLASHLYPALGLLREFEDLVTESATTPIETYLCMLSRIAEGGLVVDGVRQCGVAPTTFQG